MKHLAALNKYFWKYKKLFVLGIISVIISNYFAVLGPELTGYLVSKVQETLSGTNHLTHNKSYDVTVNAIVSWVENFKYKKFVAVSSIVILLTALLRGLFMYFQRQTLIVMSRHIEYDLKNEVYRHYQKLDAGFFKVHSTGDLMNRIAEDVSRVRMYVGPAIMYLTSLATLIIFCVINMLRKDAHLTLMVLVPLPILAITIYYVNTIINKKSTQVQASLSDLTTNAQESYSGIRVIKSFVQEKNMLGFFKTNSETYRKNAVSLAKVEAVYFPSMALMIGLSTLFTILAGGQMALADTSKVGLIVEFVIYINMLTFPVSSIGWVASMVQRAAASQKRINEFLEVKTSIQDLSKNAEVSFEGDIAFKNVSFTYQHTGIKAIDNFSLNISKGQKVLILGKTGSGKSTLAQLLLRFYDPDEGNISIAGNDIKMASLRTLREKISYVPQDVFLFSDTIANNISFGLSEAASQPQVEQSAKLAAIHREISSLEKGYQTMVGERGVTLSGGQKQRISIARALIKEPKLLVLDDCLSAVDSRTENEIINNLNIYLKDKTAVIITHRIFTVVNFDQIIILDNGTITEQGTHEELLAADGYYAELFRMQVNAEQQTAA